MVQFGTVPGKCEHSIIVYWLGLGTYYNGYYYRHSNVFTPTWKEVRHFVWFLNMQLSACEQSNIIKRVPGLRTFVVDFMTTMSRVSC